MSERYVTPHPLPQGRDAELLHCLIEECGEIIYHTSKALRFGLNDSKPGTTVVNREQIAVEVGELNRVFALCVEAGLLHADAQSRGFNAKAAKLARYMQNQGSDK